MAYRDSRPASNARTQSVGSTRQGTASAELAPPDFAADRSPPKLDHLGLPSVAKGRSRYKYSSTFTMVFDHQPTDKPPEEVFYNLVHSVSTVGKMTVGKIRKMFKLFSVALEPAQVEVGPRTFRGVLANFGLADRVLVDRLFDAFSDYGAKFDYREFVRALLSIADAPVEEKLDTVLDLYDVDGGGTTSLTELTLIVCKCRQGVPGSQHVRPFGLRGRKGGGGGGGERADRSTASRNQELNNKDLFSRLDEGTMGQIQEVWQRVKAMSEAEAEKARDDAAAGLLSSTEEARPQDSWGHPSHARAAPIPVRSVLSPALKRPACWLHRACAAQVVAQEGRGRLRQGDDPRNVPGVAPRESLLRALPHAQADDAARRAPQRLRQRQPVEPAPLLSPPRRARGPGVPGVHHAAAEGRRGAGRPLWQPRRPRRRRRAPSRARATRTAPTAPCIPCVPCTTDIAAHCARAADSDKEKARQEGGELPMSHTSAMLAKSASFSSMPPSGPLYLTRGARSVSEVCGCTGSAPLPNPDPQPNPLPAWRMRARVHVHSHVRVCARVRAQVWTGSALSRRKVGEVKKTDGLNRRSAATELNRLMPIPHAENFAPPVDTKVHRHGHGHEHGHGHTHTHGMGIGMSISTYAHTPKRMSIRT